MSGQSGEDTQEGGVELGGLSLEATLGAIMDVFEVEVDDSEAAPSSPAPVPSPDGNEPPAPAPEGTGAAGEPAPSQPAGDAGGEGVALEQTPEPSGFDAATLELEWGQVVENIEKRQAEELERTTLVEVREEHSKYFDALRLHPRELVGQEVPSPKGDGSMELLRDGNDAKEWQEAIKQILYREVTDRVQRKRDDVQPMMQNVHQSIDMFRKNPDLIPGAKQFDRELADQFTSLVKPYELRVDGKLLGYTVPVQGFIDQLREQLKAKRTAAPAPSPEPPAPTPQQQRAAEQARNTQGQFSNPDGPQAGIPSKAGSGGEEGEDFSTLFGAFGVPNLRI